MGTRTILALAAAAAMAATYGYRTAEMSEPGTAPALLAQYSPPPAQPAPSQPMDTRGIDVRHRPAPASTDTRTEQRELRLPPRTGPQVIYVTVPSGRSAAVRLRSTLSSERNHAGDGFTATLATPLTANGRVVVPAGSRVFGHVMAASATGRGKHKARLAVRFDRLGLPNGRTVAISSRPLLFAAGGETKRDVALIGAGTLVGGLIGHAAGSTAKGAIIGAGVGTGAALVARGKPVVLGSGAHLRLVLRNSVRVPVIRRNMAMAEERP